jgi:hypothetical protein
MAHSKFLKSDIIESCKALIQKIDADKTKIKNDFIDASIQKRNKSNSRLFFPTKRSTDRDKVWEEMNHGSYIFRPETILLSYCFIQYNRIQSILTMCINSCDDYVYLTDDDIVQLDLKNK